MFKFGTIFFLFLWRKERRFSLISCVHVSFTYGIFEFKFSTYENKMVWKEKKNLKKLLLFSYLTYPRNSSFVSQIENGPRMRNWDFLGNILQTTLDILMKKLRMWDKLRSNVPGDDDDDYAEKSYSWMIWWTYQKSMVNTSNILKKLKNSNDINFWFHEKKHHTTGQKI